jgi:hypothetical protein
MRRILLFIIAIVLLGGIGYTGYVIFGSKNISKVEVEGNAQTIYLLNETDTPDFQDAKLKITYKSGDVKYVDLKSSKGLLKAPTMQLLELNHEIDEILHEIQYEFITGQIRQLNANRIAAMATVSINKVKQLQEDMDKLNGNV